MPERFVEVLDVASEATSMINAFLERSQGIATEVHLNISQYINATTGQFDTRIFNVLEGYNVSSADVLRTMSMFNLSESVIATVPAPTGVGLWFMGLGAGMLVLRYAIVRWRTIKIVAEYGHAHAE